MADHDTSQIAAAAAAVTTTENKGNDTRKVAVVVCGV
jgi:hypothetical protein